MDSCVENVHIFLLIIGLRTVKSSYFANTDTQVTRKRSAIFFRTKRLGYHDDR